MKRAWHLFSSIAMAFLLLSPCFLSAQQKTQTTSASTSVSSLNLDDMDKYGLLAANPLGKTSELIKKFQLKEGTLLLNNLSAAKHPEVNVEKMRNGEVLVVTIPADDLFMPNDTVLSSGASSVLTIFKRYLKDPDMYWVVLDMHTDNTGSEVYTDNLSLQRVNAVFDWFDDQDCETRYLFPTASGAAEPLAGNNNESMAQRRQNRRLEILLIPGLKMVEEAKKGRIAF